MRLADGRHGRLRSFASYAKVTVLNVHGAAYTHGCLSKRFELQRPLLKPLCTDLLIPRSGAQAAIYIQDILHATAIRIRRIHSVALKRI